MKRSSRIMEAFVKHKENFNSTKPKQVDEVEVLQTPSTNPPPDKVKLVSCDHCDHTTKTENGMQLHKRKKHHISQGDANDTMEDEPEDNLKGGSEPVANSTIIKHTEEKSFQVQNHLDLVLNGEICADCEVELIGETLWDIPDGFYYDRWHTYSIRRSPVPGCNVSNYGDIYLKGTNNSIGTVVNDLMHTLYNVKRTGS